MVTVRAEFKARRQHVSVMIAELKNVCFQFSRISS